MNDIKKVISRGESETLEFKKTSSDWKAIIKTISAFGNTRGGNIFIGVSDAGKVSGVQIGRKTIEDLVHKIKENTDPKIFLGVSVEKADKKEIILIRVVENNHKPVFAFDRVYKRVGKSTVRVTSEEIRKMALEGKKIYWDELICEEAKLKNIDVEKVKWFVREAITQRGLRFPKNLPAE
ncbi:MAG: putative DNA binding domain-containing protein [Elusimicrobiota bacterium]|nr:putative DNA binding domain-containing protein [Elusimicrobiota bacterium]